MPAFFLYIRIAPKKGHFAFPILIPLFVLDCLIESLEFWSGLTASIGIRFGSEKRNGKSGITLSVVLSAITAIGGIWREMTSHAPLTLVDVHTSDGTVVVVRLI